MNNIVKIETITTDGEIKVGYNRLFIYLLRRFPSTRYYVASFKIISEVRCERAYSNYESIDILYCVVEDYLEDIKFLCEKIDYMIPKRLDRIKVEKLILGVSESLSP